MLLTDAYAVY